MDKYYWFSDRESGEDFFVATERVEDAREIAREYFENPHLVATLTEEESEWYPFDVY